MTHQFYGTVEEFFKRIVIMLEKEILELETKDKKSIEGDYASILIGNDYRTHFLIKSCQQLKNTLEFNKFKELVKRSKAIKKKLGKQYFRLIEANLKKVISDYSRYLTFPYKTEHFNEEFQYMLWMRDTIKASLKELKGKKPIKKYLAQLEILDQQLKEITQREKMIQSWNFDEDYYPKSFWWRHLKEQKKNSP